MGKIDQSRSSKAVHAHGLDVHHADLSPRRTPRLSAPPGVTSVGSKVLDSSMRVSKTLTGMTPMSSRPGTGDHGGRDTLRVPGAGGARVSQRQGRFGSSITPSSAIAPSSIGGLDFGVLSASDVWDQGSKGSKKRPSKLEDDPDFLDSCEPVTTKRAARWRGGMARKMRLDDAIGRQQYDFLRSECRRLFRSLVLSWRLLLDPEGNGRLSFVQFVRAVSQMGKFDVRRMWPFLDDNNSGFVTLDEWDHDAFVHLMEFRQICLDEFGSMETAFQFGLDTTGSGTSTRQELRGFCQNFEYTKSPDRLFHCLDAHNKRYITVGDLDFLTHWQGERFRHNRHEYRIPAARKALLYAEQGRRRVREARDALIDDSLGSAGDSKGMSLFLDDSRGTLLGTTSTPLDSTQPAWELMSLFDRTKERIGRVLDKPRDKSVDCTFDTKRRMDFRKFFPNMEDCQDSRDRADTDFSAGAYLPSLSALRVTRGGI